MKTMTCRQLGGACDLEFKADTFDEIAAMSRKHGMEMMQTGDAAHLQAMNEMKDLMKSPDTMNAWLMERKMEFDGLPDE